ncbi:hypothetical protein [Streptomyces acidiscabies]|uniref:Uncharacterized protein n=1 Tax=Streptomyces acidiscabies TaxID=42234 RepID=A0A0L0JIP7_9ACTN|nr:hypothetical protein [Streptomyces acidiscabies]KND25245.1 hypothetical protein IQ63_41190 [Streptomyces acidiscabies]
MSPTRFYDLRTELFHYADSALVHCPRCDRLAHREHRRGTAGEASQWRVVCRSCGLSWVREKGRGPDPHFLPLWLRADTRHGTIWAYNLEHLTVLRDFVAADLREHAPWYEHEHRRMTYVGKLPTWIKSAKNRAEILRTIDRLRTSVTNP